MNIRTTLKKTLAGFAAAALLIPSPALLASCAKQKPEGTAPAGNLPAQAEPDKEPETAAQSGTETEAASPVEPSPAPDGLILPPSDGSAPDFPNDGKVYVEYAVNYQKAGTVKNGGRREASAGGKKAEAVPNFGYRFVGWSDGLTDPVRPDSDTKIAESTRLTAIFDYDALDMPIITIDTETGRDVQSKTEYIKADLKICAAAPEYELSGTVQIRGRGNNSWGYEKKSYKMKFPEKVNLFGLGTGKDKVWVLLANVCDQSLQRNHVALELARNLDGVAFSPASLSVEVYLNGEYRGVYLLAEEIRDSKARVNIDTDGFETETDIGYLVELSSYSTGPGFTVGGKQYMIHSDLSEDQKVRREQILFITDYMERCMTAIRSGSREEVEKLMDIPSMIDTYITEEVVKNLDVGWDSYYLYKEKGGKLYLGPIWDFDLSLGNANEGEETIDGLFAATRSGSGGGNPWHYRPMEQSWFRELVLDRWNEVKPKLIDTIPAAVREEGSSKLRSYERNFIRWPIFGTRQNRETEAIRRLKTYTEHYEYLADWTEQRIAWLDSTYRKSDFLTMKLSSGGDVEDGEFADAEQKKLFDSLTNLTEEVGVKKVESSSDGFGGEGVENLFDGEAGSKYCWEPWWGKKTEILFTMKEAVTPTHYALMTANDTRNYTSRNPQKWTIYGSPDGKNWEEMAKVENGRNSLPAANFSWSVFAFDTPGTYQYYKVVINNDGISQFSEMALLG